MRYKNPQTITKKAKCIQCNTKNAIELRYYREDIVFIICMLLGFGGFIIGAIMGLTA